MTTLAIIGGGIAGRSLLFHLAKSGIPFQKILFFSSENFARSCSLNSTAIVAARGVSRGLSNLGDILSESFNLFQDHMKEDSPSGVTALTQYTGASSKIDQFKKRYPDALLGAELGPIRSLREIYHASEDAFMIDPETYLHWLLKKAENLPLEIVNDFVTEVSPGKKITIKTQSRGDFQSDKIVFAGGVYNQFWKELLSPEKESLSQIVPGSYLEFSSAGLEIPSLSLTLDGDNFIYDASRKRLLLGSTTGKHTHEMKPEEELLSLYRRLKVGLQIELPDFSQGLIKTGLREKAPKREPYLIQKENIFGIGGYYKNGFSVNLKLSRDLVGRL